MWSMIELRSINCNKWRNIKIRKQNISTTFRLINTTKLKCTFLPKSERVEKHEFDVGLLLMLTLTFSLSFKFNLLCLRFFNLLPFNISSEVNKRQSLTIKKRNTKTWPNKCNKIWYWENNKQITAKNNGTIKLHDRRSFVLMKRRCTKNFYIEENTGFLPKKILVAVWYFVNWCLNISLSCCIWECSCFKFSNFKFTHY